MEIIEFLYDYILDTEQGMRKLLTMRRCLLISLIIAVAAIFAHSLATLIADTNLQKFSSLLLSIGLVTKILTFAIVWIIITSLFHFVCSWQKLDGNILYLFILLGTTLLPFVFLPSGAIIARALGLSGYFLYFLFYLFLLGWSLKLQLQALKIVYNVPLKKAFLIYLTPFITLTVLGTILSISLILLIVSLIASSF